MHSLGIPSFGYAHHACAVVLCYVHTPDTQCWCDPCCRAQKLGSVSSECCLKARCTTLVIKVRLLYA